MPVLQNQLTDINFLSPLGFKFGLKRAPALNFFVIKASVPSISIGTANLPTPFKNVPLIGDKIEYGDLDLVFKVDENLENYLEIYNWITRITRPESFEGYKQLKDAAGSNIKPNMDGTGLYSDATLTILNSSMSSVKNFEFRNMYPVLLSGMEFNSTETDVNYVNASVRFRYQQFVVTDP